MVNAGSCLSLICAVFTKLAQVLGILLVMAGLIVAVTSGCVNVNAALLWAGFGLYCGGAVLSAIFTIIAQATKDN